MATVVGIVNSGLKKCGAKKRIASLLDGTPNANTALDLYEPTRDDLLRAGNWNFAISRIKLNQSSVAPTFEFDFAYTLPADWLRTIKVHDNEPGRGVVEYRIEGRSILSNAVQLWLKYIRVVTDPNEMTADFRELFSLALAVEFAIPIADSGTMHDRLERKLEKRMRRVRAADAIEDFPETVPDGTWVAEREGPKETW